jgi:hypothetical protein
MEQAELGKIKIINPDKEPLATEVGTMNSQAKDTDLAKINNELTEQNVQGTLSNCRTVYLPNYLSCLFENSDNMSSISDDGIDWESDEADYEDLESEDEILSRIDCTD